MNTDRLSYIDLTQTVGLGDGPHAAAVAVRADGTTDLWVLDLRYNHEATLSTPPHEQLGPLPSAYRTRVLFVPLRCGAPTRSTGEPCRLPVTRPGGRCHLHPPHGGAR